MVVFFASSVKNAWAGSSATSRVAENKCVNLKRAVSLQKIE
jgi:hypothetical protein